MSWRERYRQGSFRGVPFLTESHDSEGGLRLAVHEFPQRDTPWAEELGRKTRRWSLTCFVIGDDYMEDRDALIDALEAKGAAVLVHPYLGERDAKVETFRFSESTTEGGIARFTIDFVEPGEPLAGDASVDSGQRASDLADSVEAGAPALFAGRFSLSGLPGYAEAGAVGLITGLAGSAENAARLLGGAGKVLRTYEAGLQLLDGAITLARTPFALAETVRGVIRSVAALGTVPLLRLRALRRMIADGQSYRPVIGMTPVRVRERANAIAFSDLVVSLAAAEAVRTAVSIRFASHEEAVALRDSFGDELDSAALAAADRGDDATAATLDSLRLAMVRDVTVRGANLARVYGYVPPSTESALVIAHRLYGPVALEARTAEIVARNRIRHPGFVPGGVALEVLSAAEAING